VLADLKRYGSPEYEEPPTVLPEAHPDAVPR